MIKEREHRRLILQKEEEKKKKQEEYQRQTQKLLEDQQHQVQLKKKKMDEQELIRQQKFEEQNNERRRIARELQEYHHKKIEMAKTKNEQLIESQRKVMPIDIPMLLKRCYYIRNISESKNCLKREDKNSKESIKRWSLRNRDKKEIET